MMAEVGSCDVVCDLCEDEQAVSFCDECHSKVCKFCEALHIKQKKTKTHNLTTIENVKLLVLHVKCSLCDGQAERFCSECNVRLCTKCAEAHHKLSDTTGSSEKESGDKPSDGQVITVKNDGSDQTTNVKQSSNEGFSHDSIKILSKDSMSQRSATIVTVLCDLCEEETAACFCEDCQKQFCAFCQQGHIKQKQTKYHKLSAVENTKQSILHAICSSCKGLAEKVCNQCEVRFCTKCSDAHHYLSETFMPRTQISNTEPECAHSSREASINKTSLPPKNGLNQVTDQEYDSQVSGQIKKDEGLLAEGGSSKCVNPTRCQASEQTTSKDGNEVERPGRPCVERIYTDRVCIFWDKVNNFCERDEYQVSIENTQTRKREIQTFHKNTGTIEGLLPGKTYVFKVRLVMANGEESKYGDTSEAITTLETFASKFVQTLKPWEKDRKGPDIYALPLIEIEEARNTSAMTQKYQIGHRESSMASEKTIMLVGATGTGKSTLVDGIANYIMGVRLEDEFRFTVNQEKDKVKQPDQAESQTDWITCYSFCAQEGTRLKYTLNVVDTPGFGDTWGLDRDQMLIAQIEQLFETRGQMGVQTIDAVCFLIKAPDSRLTATQKYIFHAIMSLFGKDIEGNICTLITFADGSDPPVLSAVKTSGFPFGKNFTFNNSALFSDPNYSFTSMFWKMGLQSFESVFSHIETLQCKSLQLTKEVLQERQRLEITCQNLLFNINAGLSTIQRLNQEIRLFEQNQNEIERNSNFTYQVSEIKIVKMDLPLGTHVTNCIPCNRTCHNECRIPADEDKNRCLAMDSERFCKQCPDNCTWRLHKNAPFRIDYSDVIVTKTYDDMKQKYEVAKGKTLSLKQVLERMEKELDYLNSVTEGMVDEMRVCSNRLKEIALCPNPLGMVDQIDLLIQAEKHEHKQGYLQRIDTLNKYREKAVIDEHVHKLRQETVSVKSTLNDSDMSKNKKKFLSKDIWEPFF